MDMYPIEKLKEWKNNPRTITKENFQRLKHQIKKLGQYKPLIITEDGTVVGGNMRLRAYRELGIQEVWVSIVDAPTEEKKLAYALSDNDNAGEYDVDEVARLLRRYPDVDIQDYAIHLAPPQPIEDVLEPFNDIESGNEDRERTFKTITVTCPHCKKTFEITV